MPERKQHTLKCFDQFWKVSCPKWFYWKSDSNFGTQGFKTVCPLIRFTDKTLNVLFFHEYLLPNTGVERFSALDTIDGIPVKAETMASKKLEWGAATMMGASSRLATFPFTSTWNPIMKNKVRVRHERLVWIILLVNRNTKISSKLQLIF